MYQPNSRKQRSRLLWNQLALSDWFVITALVALEISSLLGSGFTLGVFMTAAIVVVTLFWNWRVLALAMITTMAIVWIIASATYLVRGG